MDLPLPTFWKDENVKVPVVIVNASGVPQTGIVYSGLSVKYTRAGDSTMQVYSPSVGDWSERGVGVYALALPGTVLNQEGMFVLVIDPPSSLPTYRGISSIDRRPEARVLNQAASGYPDGTIGSAVNFAGTSDYQVFSNPQYDYNNRILDFAVWLHKDGAIVTVPTSCRIIVKDSETGALIADLTNALPDANGVFYLQKTALTLTANRNYKILVTVTYNGVDYKSGGGAQSLN